MRMQALRRIHGPYERARVVEWINGRQIVRSFRTKSEADAVVETAEREILAQQTAGGLADGLLASMVELPMAPFWVYALLDSDDVPVYVGMTSNPGVRVSEHVAGKKDFSRVAILPQPLTKGQAAALERAIVQVLKPRFNQQLQPGKASPLSRFLPGDGATCAGDGESGNAQQIRCDNCSCAEGDSNPHGVTH